MHHSSSWRRNILILTTSLLALSQLSPTSLLALCSAEQIQPCYPPLPSYPQNHIAPQTPKYAIVGILYSDWSGPPLTDTKLRSWYDGKPVEFLYNVSGGCLEITYEIFVVTALETERKADGRCRVDQPEDLGKLQLPDIPGYNPGDYFGSLVTPMSSGCVTSASAGGLGLMVGGGEVSIDRGILLGQVWGGLDGDDDNDDPLGNHVFVHEMLHSLGAGYHSNAKACNYPGTDQTNPLACPTLEYGDLFDVLGSSSGHTPNINAAIRYHFGWMAKWDVALIDKRGTFKIAPLERRGSFYPHAAVLPHLGLWLEWRQVMDAPDADDSYLKQNEGFFIRQYASLIDADLHSCENNQWGNDNHSDLSPERIRTTLYPGNTLNLPNEGVLIQVDPAGIIKNGVQGATHMVVHVHYTGSPPPCNPRAPHISTGLRGEWKFCDSTNPERCDFTNDPGLASLLSKYGRTTRHVTNGVDDGDSKGCSTGSGDAVYDLSLVSELPAGWGFATQIVNAGSIEGCTNAGLCGGPKWSPIGGGFAFGIPDNAPDGDYDVCIAVTKRSSGLMGAKIHRLTLPEGDNNWYTNNRPNIYQNVDPDLEALCRSIDGSCAVGRTDCQLPATDNCQVNLQCPSSSQDSAVSEWGRCWQSTSSIRVGVHYRGRNMPSVTQSVCEGGPPLIEVEDCDNPIKDPCVNQNTCKVGSDVWKQLTTERGDTTGICGRCNHSSGQCNKDWTGLCHKNGPGFGHPVCNDVDAGANGSLGASHPCMTGHNTFDEPCVRTLCETHDLCGGYMVSESNNAVYLYPTDISRPTNPNPTNPHKCYVGPLERETECSCFGGPLVPSEGCSDYGFYDIDQWNGPKCTNSPTQSPTSSPLDSPTKSPTSCTQDDDAEFLRGKKKTKTCGWLSNRSATQQAIICETMTKYSKTHKPAENICEETCNSCDQCFENPKGKSYFFWKFNKKGKAKYKTCKWLQKRNRAEKQCAKINTYAGRGPPKEVCPMTCSAVTGCSR